MQNNMIVLLSTFLLFSTSCATMDDSLKFGAGMGAATGAFSTYAAHKSTNGKSPAFRDVALGAGIGVGVGLISSYLIHRNVEDHRKSMKAETDMYFGDLPPNPFVVPKNRRY